MRKKELPIIIFLLLILIFIKYAEKYDWHKNIPFFSTNSHFTVTADTNVSQVPGLSKYVTQEEVNSFAFRYWDIDHNYTKNRNPLMLKLKAILKSKDTKKVLNFLKDNNLSVDVNIEDKTTPLMYSSFYNDLNTSKELIKLGANPHAKDRYGLSPLAYAIENNSTKTARLLVDNGVRFEEVEQIQFYLKPPLYPYMDKLIINGDKIEIIYKDKWNKDSHSKDEINSLEYIVHCNFIELAKMMLESGYKPKLLKHRTTIPGLYTDNNISVMRSVYPNLSYIPNYKPMLELLLKHNVVGGKIEKEELKKAYDRCYDNYLYYLDLVKRFKKGEDLNLQWKPSVGIYRLFKYNKKHCSVKNSTFKGTKDFFAWSNDLKKNDSINEFIRGYQDDTSKVIYINNNLTKEKIKRINR